jgi:hypothetical protein
MSAHVRTSAPKGKALAEWYAALGSDSATGDGIIECRNVHNNFNRISTPDGQVWGSSVPDKSRGVARPAFLFVQHTGRAAARVTVRSRDPRRRPRRGCGHTVVLLVDSQSSENV